MKRRPECMLLADVGRLPSELDMKGIEGRLEVAPGSTATRLRPAVPLVRGLPMVNIYRGLHQRWAPRQSTALTK